MLAARQRRFDVVVWRFYRFARSTSHPIRALDDLRSLGIAFCSFSEALDTSASYLTLTTNRGSARA
jgi:DNA invertase Pin-like site-specific DNA recombinase